jgi:PAS domain S-box-containing protein
MPDQRTARPTDNGVKKAAQAKQIERFQLLVDSVQDYAIFLLDTKGNVASWNAGARRLKGYEDHDIIGRHFSTFYPEVDKKAGKPERELVDAIADGRVEDEGWRVRKDGTQFWASVVITALYDEAGVLQGFAKVTRDLTERKAMEDELSRANEDLRRQQEELLMLNQAKDEFISLASHQLRTPATGVKQYLGMIMQGFTGEVDPKLLDYVRKAYASNERQIALVNDLLRVAQVDAGRIVLQLALVDVAQLIRDVVAEQRDSFEKRSQKVQVQLPTQVVGTMDPRRLRMVVENVIDNASKYTPEGGKIQVTCNIAGGWLQIAVADSGVGIERKDINKLFNKFTRLPNELSDSVGGSGLGLYWANKIVELHGGHVEVTSEQGQGATFTVNLPLEKNA